MTPVTPRWEWRTFGAEFEGIDRRFLATPHAIRRSREAHLIADASDLDVRIRAGQLDVRALEQRDRGLELWRPVLKASFPLERAAIAALFEGWELPIPDGIAGGPSETVDRIAATCPTVHVVDVDETRHGMVVDGCAVEQASLVVSGQPLRTVAVEMEDPDRVLRTVRELGLSAFENVNYVTALKRLRGSGTRA